MADVGPGWEGDIRFAGVSTEISVRHYQDAVSESVSKNRIVINAKERYLRREVGDVLSWPPHEAAPGQAAGHVLIPDVAFARDFVEFIEVPDVEALLLGTVLEALQTGARSRREYLRLRACAAKPTRKIGIFHNQYFVETNAEVTATQSHGQHQTASFAMGAAWISQHSSLDGRSCVVVSDNPAVREAALQAGFVGATECSKDYFATRWADTAAVQTLVESVTLALEARAAEERAALAQGSGKQSRHRRWWNEDEIGAAVQAGTLERGSLQVDEHRPEEAWIRVSNDSTRPDAVDLFLPTRAHRGRSVHGDIVAVEPLGKEEWATPSFHLARRDATEEGQDESRGTAQRSASSLCPTGRVVGVMERTERQYVATIEDDVSTLREGATVAVLAIPMDLRIPKLRIRTRKATAMNGCRLVCAIDDWSIDSTYPAAHVVRVLGPIGDVDVESEAILVECGLAGSHSLPYESPSLKPFWEHVPRPVGSSGSFKFAFTSEDIRGRRDLRDQLIMSIDPPGCVDIDDALSLRRLPNGRMELGVHIADVTHYVPEHSDLDREAFARSTTCYLVDRRLDMLPALLSTNLCSLRGGEDRCAVSVIWELEHTENGWVAVDTWFGRTLIRSAWEGSYQVAQAIIDGEPDGAHAEEAQRVFGKKLEDVRMQLRQMLDISVDFMAQRKARGALELHSSEVDFDLVRPAGSGNGDKKQTVEAKSVLPHATLPVMDMVAEYMIFANSSVAQQIYNAFPLKAALRRHPLPRTERFDELVATAALQGITLDPSSNAALAASLAEAEKLGDPHVASLLKTMATRAMSEAAYFCTGDFSSPEEFYHYGLAADYYTHFTSPIRRYADVIVHRQLIKSLDCKRSNKLERTRSGAPTVSDQCHHMNQQHRMAKLASERSQALFFSLFFRVSVLTRAEAVVSAVRANGAIVYIPKFEFHGSVYLRSKNGYAFVPVGDNTSDAVEDSSAGIEFEQNGDKKQRKLRAMRTAGGDELYSIQVFDHIVVNIVGQQSKYHLADVKLSFVGLAPAGGLAGAGSRHHRPAAVPPSRGKQPGKNTLGSLRVAVEDEKDAKAQRVAEAQQATLHKLRQKAGLIAAEEHGRKGRNNRAQKKGYVPGLSLYARLNGANVPSAHTTTETASLHISAETLSSSNDSIPPRRGTLDATKAPSPTGTVSRERSAGRRKLGGGVAMGDVVPLRELEDSSASVRIVAPAACAAEGRHTGTASNSHKHLAKGPLPGQGFTMRRTVLSTPHTPAIQSNLELTSPEPEPEALAVGSDAYGQASSARSSDADPTGFKSKASASSASASSSSGSSSDSEEDLEAFLDSVLD